MTSTRLQGIIDSIESKGLEVEKRSDYWQTQCPCPGHDDDTPSVTWKEQPSGKITVKCHAGCEGSEILKALDLNFEVLYPDDNSRKASSKKSQKRIVATYPYTDANGELLFEAVRFHPKDFRQRVPDVNGGYKWSIKGVKRVIYNLPAVIDAIEAGKPVFLVEGEKDADALNKRGLVATTVPMGAGKWSKDYNDYFNGADIIILPDNDVPGREHAVTVADHLSDFSKSVRILQLPDIQEKEDVSDWLDEGGTKDEFLELAFDCPIISGKHEALEAVGMDADQANSGDEESIRHLNNHFFEEDHKIYSTREDERLVADFSIDIVSFVKDDKEGRVFYIKIREKNKNKVYTSDLIEVHPESLDTTRSFYPNIRPYTMGEIIQTRNDKVTPLQIFKWLLTKFERPIVRRPDHLGFIESTNFDNRPFWLFANALICPPHGEHEGKIIYPNEHGEFIVDEHHGFAVPNYDSEKEKEQLAPIIKTDTDGAAAFMGTVKEKLLQLIGGGDTTGKAKNYAKILLGYVVYHLFENELFHANDMNGHTVIMYIYGAKGSGKTTYFGTILQAFFGLHKTKAIKGNTVTIPALENRMGHYSQLPLPYDEFNVVEANIDYQNINSHYHKVSRTVSDVDRAGRNKYTPIRSTLSLISNFPINLDVDQADATESRVVYIEYKKDYRSTGSEFEWFEDNLDDLSRITSYLLLNQTDKDRENIKLSVRKLYNQFRKKLDKKVEENPKKYVAEHRLTDNYTRLLACYEYAFGKDIEFRKFIFQEILDRFEAAKSNQKENTIINQIIYLAAAGRIKESWHYHYNNNQEELYLNLSQMYEAYAEYKRDKAVSNNQFKDIIKSYLDECGGYEVKTKKWYGSYFNRENEKIEVNKPMWSYIITYKQLGQDNLLRDMFPATEEQTTFIRKYEHDYEGKNEQTGKSDNEQDGKPENELDIQLDMEDEAPF